MFSFTPNLWFYPLSINLSGCHYRKGFYLALHSIRTSIQIFSIFPNRHKLYCRCIDRVSYFQYYIKTSFHLSGTPSLTTSTRAPSCTHLDNLLCIVDYIDQKTHHQKLSFFGHIFENHSIQFTSPIISNS